MLFKELIFSSMSTLKMNGRRTFLTMIGIIIGISSVITILSLGNGFKQETMHSLAKDTQGRRSQMFYFQPVSGLSKEEKIKPFNESDLRAIRQIQGVSDIKIGAIEALKSTDVEVKVKDKVMSYNTGLVKETHYSLTEGRNLDKLDSESKKRYVVIEEQAAYEILGQKKAILNRSICINKKDYTIVGVFKSEDNITSANSGMFDEGQPSRMDIPKESYELYSTSNSIAEELTVYFSEGVNMTQVSKEIKKYLDENGSEKDRGDYQYQDMSEMMTQIGKTLNMITYFISAVAAISLFIAGVGVMNMMYISVSERTKEIGIRRSLGATERSIKWQFLLEGIAITAVGGVIGYIIGIGIASLIGNVLPFKPLIDFKMALLSVLISTAIGIVFSVFPAKSAAKKNLVEILR